MEAIVAIHADTHAVRASICCSLRVVLLLHLVGVDTERITECEVFRHCVARVFALQGLRAESRWHMQHRRRNWLS
jgi:hypothetical protein